MLKFIVGRAGTGKTYAALKNAVDQASDYRMTYIIVPEQSTLSYERQLIRYNSESYRRGVEVLSFTRIVEKVMLVTGGLAGNYIDKMGKTALVYRAIKDCSDSLRFFGRYSDSPQFAAEFSETIDELKVNNVSSDTLIEVGKSQDLPKTLSDKLYDTALIVREYERLIRGSFFDPVDSLTALCELLDGYPFFEGCAVYFDGFNGFSPNEEEIIKRIILQSDNCVMTVTAPSLEYTGELFYPVVSFARGFSEYAKSVGISLGKSLVLTENRKYRTDTMLSLEDALCSEKEGLEGGENVIVYSAADSYDEMRFVAAEIRRLVREERCRYKDIAVIAGELEAYRSAVETEFEMYGIPFFIDSRSDVRFRPLMRLILFALRAVTGGMFYEDMCDVAKTGLAGINSEEAAILENYVNLWKISGKKWENEFVLNPRGFVETKTEKDIELLAEINRFRRMLAEPLFELKRKLATACVADDYAVALYEYLIRTGVPEVIKKEKNDALPRGEDYDGERIWDLLMDVFDRISSAMGQEKLSVENYRELIKLLFENADVGVIPPHIDEVLIGSEGRVRIENIRYCFIIGATEGVFPNISGRKGIFTNADKEELMRRSVNLIRDDETRRCEMLLSVYNALTLPSDGVRISFNLSEGETGYSAPSPVIKQLKNIFPACSILTEKELGYDFLCATPDATLALGAEFYDAPKTAEQSSVRAAMLRYTKLADLMQIYSRMRENGKNNLDKDAAEYLSGKTKRLSATKSDEYYKCAFKFYCKYGLSLNTEPEMKFDALTVGTFIHYMLEKTVAAIYSDKLDNDVAVFAEKLSAQYVQEVLGGAENLPVSFLNSLSRTTALIVELISNIRSELEVSGYVPVDFEVEIEDGGKITPWRVAVGNGDSIRFIGKVDRVDMCSRNGREYLRIVDYKSGKTKKELLLGNIYDGIDIQMLVYIIAVWLNGGKAYGQQLTPAGIYYFPANRPLLERDDKFDKKLSEAVSMSGMTLEESPHDERIKPSFYNISQLELLKKHIERLFCDMHKNLKEGRIPRNPAEGKYKECDYCPYTAICGVDTENVTARKIGKLKHEEVFEKLREEYENE